MKKMLFMSFAAKLSTGSGKLQPATQFPAFFVDNCRKKFFQILPFDYMRAELLRGIFKKPDLKAAENKGWRIRETIHGKKEGTYGKDE